MNKRIIITMCITSDVQYIFGFLLMGKLHELHPQNQSVHQQISV